MNKKDTLRERRKARIRSKITGTAERPRLSVYRSNTNMYAQLIDDVAGVTLASASDLAEKKGTKIERAQAVGTAIAKAASDAKIKTCVFDRSGFLYTGRVKALADAARSWGLEF